MSRKLNKASALAVAATMMAIVVSADSSGAAAESKAPVAIQTEPDPSLITVPTAEPLVERELIPEVAIPESRPADADQQRPSASLAALVTAQPQPAEWSRELSCLAGAIYFEAKGETLPGQLAVGRVIVARSKSGRFPNSYCGVVFQRSQFSFVRGNSMPGIDKRSRHWRNAVAVAQIAHDGSWASPVEGALFFHATYVSPGWRLKRMARVDNHIFYR